MEKKLTKSDEIKINKIVRNLLYLFSLFMFCYNVYNYLIPHTIMIDSGVEYTRLTGHREIEVNSEVSVIAFILPFLIWSVIPFYIAQGPGFNPSTKDKK